MWGGGEGRWGGGLNPGVAGQAVDLEHAAGGAKVLLRLGL